MGLIHGNVVRPLCFDIGEQRYERHIIKSWCRLETLATATCPSGRTVGGALLCLSLLVLLIVKYTGATKRVFASRLSTYLSLPSTDTGHPVRTFHPLRRNINDALKRSVSDLNCKTAQPPSPQGMGRHKTYHAKDSSDQPNKRVKTSRGDILLLLVGVARQTSRRAYKLPTSNLPYSNFPTGNLPTSNLPTGNIQAQQKKSHGLCKMFVWRRLA